MNNIEKYLRTGAVVFCMTMALISNEFSELMLWLIFAMVINISFKQIEIERRIKIVDIGLGILVEKLKKLINFDK